MENPCSIFVGSLSPNTTTEMLEDYFGRFGPIESAVVLQDQVSQTSRGFGFVNFKNPESKTNALQMKTPHFIDNKKVECKAAIRKGEQQRMDQPGGRQGGGARYDQPMYDNQRKVFVGGISNGTSDDDIKMALSKFGSVETVEQKYDKVSQRMRGFGFVEFSSAKEAMDAVQAQFVQINGKTVEIKIAENRQAVPYGLSASGGFGASSFGNNMGMYGPPIGYSSFTPYTANTSSGYGAGGAATGYSMGSNPGFGGNPGYGNNSQYQNYPSKDGGNPYGAGNMYNTGSGFGGGSGSNHGGAAGSGYSGYGRGGYHPYGQ